MTLAIDGGTPVRTRPFATWPPPATDEQRAALLDVLESGVWGSPSGTRGTEFAARFAARHGAAYGVALANGTLGLVAALRAVGVRKGDEVIVPTFTFVATATSVLMLGAVPVFADIDPDTMLLDAASVAARLTDRTTAVVPVHLAGAVADVDAIRAVLPERVRIVEDAAQAAGAALRGRPVGTLGDIASFSFQSSKNITAGEGGAVVTNDEEVYRAAWSAVNVGRAPAGAWYEHPVVGWNMRLTEFQAAALTGQLEALDELNARRDRGAELLARGLAGVAGFGTLPDPESTTTHGRHLALLRFDPAEFGGASKERLAAALGAEGIPVSAGYPLLHEHPAIRAESGRTEPDACPTADAVGPRTIWVSQTVLLSEPDDIDDVVLAVAKVQKHFRD